MRLCFQLQGEEARTEEVTEEFLLCSAYATYPLSAGELMPKKVNALHVVSFFKLLKPKQIDTHKSAEGSNWIRN